MVAIPILTYLVAIGLLSQSVAFPQGCRLPLVKPLPLHWVAKSAINTDQASSPLLVSDLPSRFDPAPRFLKQLVLHGMAGLTPTLQKEGISIREEDVLMFVDLGNAELVMAMTARLPNARSRKQFDAGLRRQDAQELFVQGLQQSLRSWGKVTVYDAREIKPLQGIGEAARGFALQAKIEKIPFRLWGNAIAFRRGKSGAIVITGTLGSESEGINIRKLATIVDRRLSVANVSPSYGTRNPDI
jgi:hypothetical protein